MPTSGSSRLCAAFLVAFILIPCLLLPARDAFSREATGTENDEAGGEESKPRVFGFNAGIQGSYSTGISTSSFYYQPFVDLYLKHNYVRFTAGMSRFQDMQITDGEGEFETVNFTQPKLALSLYPHRVIELFGEYYYSTGDKKHYYRSHEGTAGFFLDFGKVTLGATATKSRTEYHFKSDDRKDKTSIVYQSGTLFGLWLRYQYYKRRYITRSEDMDVFPELSWFVHHTTSLDAKYEYRETIFEYVPGDFQYHHDRYYTHTGRLGVSSDPWRYFSLRAGVVAGKDSEEYIIAGGDVGVTFNILDYVMITSTYTPEYYMAPETNAVLQTIKDLIYRRLWGRPRIRNPLLRNSGIGTSFWNHGVSFSVVYTY